MGIFKKNITNNNVNTVFVGSNLALHSNTYLTLYSIATGISKSKLISNLITQFKENTEGDMNVHDLAEQVAKNGYKEYKVLAKLSTFSSVRFYNDMKKELLKKGIDEETSELIIKMVKNEAKH